MFIFRQCTYMIIKVSVSQSLGTTDTEMLFNAEHTITILSIIGITKSIGTQPITKENLCLVASIKHLMCILILARHLVSSTTVGDSCEQP